MRNILADRFRANPLQEIVRFDKLTAGQQELLAELTSDPDFYGVLRPAAGQPNGSLKSVCRNTAALYDALRTPGPLPAALTAQLAEDGNLAVGGLVMDGVLEIEHAGRFLSGSAAYAALYDDQSDSVESGAIGALSIAALRYGQALPIDDAVLLSARLYFYNRLPITPQRMRQFPSGEAVLERLRASDRGRVGRMLDQRWRTLPIEAPNDGWHMWRLRGATSGSDNSATPTWKLYISPNPNDLDVTFQAIVAAFTELRVPAFKLGKGVHGLLRPDKLIAYFLSEEHLHQVAARLRSELDGCHSHGVPFTAALSDEGLLSWGIDPPRAARLFSWREPESWRLWVTNQLATALLAARSDLERSIEPWQFALERLRLAGVDTTTWTPDPTIWSG